MPLPVRKPCTSEDYWNLPADTRAELVDGALYDMAPPSWEHQAIVAGIVTDLNVYIRQHGGACRAVPSPVAVNLDADDETWVEPDVVVVCDPNMISHRGVEGAPDLVVEVVSSSSAGMDYIVKTARYRRAGVGEYWIVDPQPRQTVVYRFDGDAIDLRAYPFDKPVPVGLFPGLDVKIADFLTA